MSSPDNLNKRLSDNMPVFFTGLAEGLVHKPKIFCNLCGSNITSTKNKDGHSEDKSGGCQKCARNLNNLKAALNFLSRNPSSPPYDRNNTYNKRRSLLPSPDEPSTSNGDYHQRDSKRKSSFDENHSKRVRTDSSHTPSRYSDEEEESGDRLSLCIWRLYNDRKQTQKTYKSKMALRDKLHVILLDVFPNCGLYVVGSSMTGLGGNSSDMDMCLMLTDEEIDQEREATNILLTVESIFKKCKFLRDVQLIYAKVPILRFTHIISDIEVDLNVNNSVGIRNTQLLSSYARMDKRLPPLVLLVKEWARCHNINDAKHNTLSSYSLVLMVIHYLQYGCQPPVLPCLQRIQPDKYRPNSNVRKLKLKEELPIFTSDNQDDVGDLFVGFLNYFTYEFDFFRSVMSVRLGGILPKEVAMNNNSPKNKKAHWKWVCIEEPFNLTNTACAVFKPEVFQYIKHVFEDCSRRIKRTLDLRSVLH